MDEKKIEHLKGLSVIAATKRLMQKYNLSHEEAYKKLLESAIYTVLNNSDSNLFLENDNYLNTALDLEFTAGKDAMYQFIQQN